jgi:hypothetical protein
MMILPVFAADPLSCATEDRDLFIGGVKMLNIV